MTRASLAGLLDRAELLWPSRTAAVDGDLALDYRTLAVRVRGLARGLWDAGVRTGDRVAALCDNHAAFLELHFAVARLGAILVPINTRLSRHEVEHILDFASPSLVFADAEHAHLCGARAASIDSIRREGTAPVVATGVEHPAQIYFTSGTTGTPKGVVLTHGNVHAHAMATIAELGLGETDVWAHVAPMFHLADAWATFAITAVGGRHVFLRRFAPGPCLDLFERERVTVTNLVPTMLNRLVHEGGAASRDYSTFRLLLSGGAPIAPHTVRRIRETFRCRYVQTYGMTETSPYLTFSIPLARHHDLDDDARLALSARTGRPVLGVELRVVDTKGAPVPRDDCSVGEIQVRGPTVTPGYWNAPEATAAAFTADGFLCTGDLAAQDADGSVRIVDRIKDVIKTGGESVFSTEVEFRLHEHPAVLEAAVFGIPDDDLGERVTAAVALKPGHSASETELIAFCRSVLAGFQTPKSIRFVDALPRTGSGKISKRMLRDASPLTGR